jgi:hypothetical protein
MRQYNPHIVHMTTVESVGVVSGVEIMLRYCGIQPLNMNYMRTLYWNQSEKLLDPLKCTGGRPFAILHPQLFSSALIRVAVGTPWAVVHGFQRISRLQQAVEL